ncbi:potassium channel subfamily K member 13-like [Anguilla anguilla]|uniref:potassium channel subfamily K member 13-like n=1 Tax=Anguilla anguilla TaxID=7936 RepID=UPI0015AD0847|nr:potassium channel subfamily K member 13-like [Anguilla anguilla]
MACRSGCCCGFGPVNEDNARFLMLALFIIIYLLCGAAVFSALEHPKEKQAKDRWAQRFEHFTHRHNLSKKELENFLRHYEEANVAGIRVDTTRPRWDFTGAFYFVGTVVSTIGFGMTTPATVGGKIFLIFYGLIGCAATILFFNLFLERLITVLAFVLKSCHERQRRRRGVLPHSLGTGAGPGLAGWKPSVYYVMLILGLGAVLVSCGASAMYSSVEGWSYADSLYFCFVAFSTIGFGDLVSGQRERYESQGLYLLGNFLCILTGVCCIYSLFNVISIVIKQVLNWILARMAHPCCCPRRPAGGTVRHRRNVVMPGHFRTRRDASIDTDAINESETDGRRVSGEMISMKDFLAANKVNLAIMQKQLSETANGHPRPSGSNTRHNGFSGGVGALGIMNNRLAETSVDR